MRTATTHSTTSEGPPEPLPPRTIRRAAFAWMFALVSLYAYCDDTLAFTTNIFSIQDDPKRAPKFSTAQIIFPGGYGGTCAYRIFDTEEQAYAYFKQCAPAGPFVFGSETRYYEGYTITSATPWTRGTSFNDYINSAGQAFYFTATVRSVFPDHTSYSQISGNWSLSRLLGCDDSYGFKDGQHDFPGVVFPKLICNPRPDPVERAQCPANGNPILIGQMRKRQDEIDFQIGVSALRFSRIYDSSASPYWGSSTILGAGWRHTYDRRLQVVRDGDMASVRHFGIFPETENFFYKNGVWRQDADVADLLDELKDETNGTIGWNYVLAVNGSTERFDATDMLVSITERNGIKQTLTYSDASTPRTIAPAPGLLINVADNFGRELNFAYDGQKRLTTMADPAGGIYSYAYDEASGNCSGCNNLTSVTYPDGRKRIYWYNEGANTSGANLPHALTGISDENGVRFATFKFDGNGRVVDTEHANGVERYTANYSTPFVKTVMTDPLGTQRAHNFATILGVVKSTGQSQPGGSGCGPSASALTYDVNGNLASQTDFNGNKTTYTYDLSRNLETQRVEASGTAKARTISTTWHANYRLPLTVAEPNKITTFTYDASGNVLTKSEQATTDANGSLGLAAIRVGTARTWNYTYNSFGQVLSAPDSNGAVTTNTYDAMGNLATVTNALGQVTSFANYDANGRVGKITDPNGLITTLAYSPRGWLISKSVGGEVTAYAYDGVGQLKTLTQPDGSTITYTYDDAHRLTAIADSLGNSIHYTLDAMGNRTAEQVKDPSGTLARQTSRAYDALNRLQQITGGLQ